MFREKTPLWLAAGTTPSKIREGKERKGRGRYEMIRIVGMGWDGRGGEARERVFE